MKFTPAQRFWHKVNQGPGGCWTWDGQRRANGYGSFPIQLADRWTTTTAHRWAYTDQVGPIPDGYEIDHLCRRRECVRPDHLEAVTLQENRRRRDVGYALVVATDPRPIPEAHRPEPAPRTRPPKGFIGPRLPRPKATRCPNGHDYAVVGRVSNGKTTTCAECRKIKTQAKRKGGQHGSETHCPQGHPYDEANTYVRPRGGRECRTCILARNRAAYARRRAVLA